MTHAHFSRVVIIQSLQSGESPTGRHLRDAIEQTAQERHGISVEYVDAQTVDEFMIALDNVRETTERGPNVPILHFECHGTSDKKGLYLADGTSITWSALKTHLVPINRATRCNLFVTLACCHGAMLMECLDIFERSPCWGLLGPSGEVSSLDLKNSYSAFFLELLESSNADAAIVSLMQSPERRARYFLLTAEDMFQSVVDLYQRSYSSEPQHQERIERFNRVFEKHGAPVSVLNSTDSELRLAEQNILEKIYNRFFFVDHYPENRLRFPNSYSIIMGQQGSSELSTAI